MSSGNVGPATGSYNWANALSRGLCLDRKWARMTASARFEVALQSALKTFSQTMAFNALLVMVRRMRT